MNKNPYRNNNNNPISKRQLSMNRKMKSLYKRIRKSKKLLNKNKVPRTQNCLRKFKKNSRNLSPRQTLNKKIYLLQHDQIVL